MPCARPAAPQRWRASPRAGGSPTGARRAEGGGRDAPVAADTAACREAPKSAVDVLPVLFKRPLGDSQIFFAMGEAIAHLHYLHAGGQVVRTTDAQGVARYAPRSVQTRAAA